MTDPAEATTESPPYRQLVEHSPTAITLVQDGRIVYANEAMATLLGAEAAEAVVGEAISRIVRPEHRDSVTDRLRRAASGETVAWETGRVRTFDDEDLDVEAVARPAEFGGRAAVQVVLREVTALVERERALEAARDRFRSVFEHSNDAVIIFDPKADEILEANPRASELLGYSVDELRALGPSDIHPDELESFRSFVEAIRSEGRGWTDRLSCLTDSGEQVPAEISAATLEFDGRPAIIAAIRDLSEIRRYERELERQNERLDEFVGVVSHDLRNPLNVAAGRLDMAQEECDSEHLEAVEAALDRMDDLIGDLLTLTRVGAAAVSPEPVELRETATRCWQSVATADAALEVAAEGTVRADPGLLQQLLENLVRNAVEHGGDGVTIRIGDTADGFWIEDDGPGILAADREQVFDGGFSTREGGTGLGLSIVRTVAEVHGWDVRVDEGEAGGARFEVTGVDRPE